MATNDLVVQAIAGANGQTTTSFIGQIQNGGASNALAILKQQLDKVRSADTLTDAQKATRDLLKAQNQDIQKKSGALSTLNQQLNTLGNLANQLNGFGGLRAEETKTVKVIKTIHSQKTVENLGNPLDVTTANLEDDKLKLGNADVLFGGKAENATVQLRIQVAADANNAPVGLPAGTVTAQRVGNSDQIRLLDANGNVIDLTRIVQDDKKVDDKGKDKGGDNEANKGELKDITGVSVAKVTTTTVDTTTTQETLEQQRQTNLKKIRETFGAFVNQLNTVQATLAENTKKGGALEGDTGARQLQASLNQATRGLAGLDVDKFVNGATTSFAKFEAIGRTAAQNVSNVAARFVGPGGDLGGEVTSLQNESKNVNSQLGQLAQIGEENRKNLLQALSDIGTAVLSIGSQKKFLKGVGNSTNGSTTPQIGQPAFNIPRLNGNVTQGVGLSTVGS